MATDSTARRDPDLRWLIAAVIVTAAASLVLLLVPMVSMVESGQPGHTEWESLLELEGWHAVPIVTLPVLLAAIPLALPRGSRWVGTLVVTFLMAAGVVLGILSIGVFYLPGVVLLIVAAARRPVVG